MEQAKLVVAEVQRWGSEALVLGNMLGDGQVTEL